MTVTELILPGDFDSYGWEVEAKGIFWDATVKRGQRQVRVTFYEPTRLAQDVSEELSTAEEVLLARIIVVKQVTRTEMERSVGNLPDEFFV